MNSNLISEKDYRSYLKEIAELIDLDPAEGTENAKRLKLLALAVEEFEKNRFFFERPTSIEAIKFRMDEMGLNQVDIAPYLGGKNRASEILSGKRPLTLPMVKALNKYLKIPLEVLLQDEEITEVKFNVEQISFDKEIANELAKQGWIKKRDFKTISEIRKAIDAFLKPIGGLGPANVLCRQSAHISVRNKTSESALFLWSAKVLIEAQSMETAPFDQSTITLDFLREVVRLSVFDEGPLLAREFLKKHGIRLVIVPHLLSTYLDGGVLIDQNGIPVIGLTLRYDRLDNFWHTLLHELAHIHKHIRIMKGSFIDDSDYEDETDPVEREADQIARDTAIPRAQWKASDVLQTRTKEAIISFAKMLHVHPAIVAGRVQFETKNFKLFPDLLGSGVVRKKFGVA